MPTITDKFAHVGTGTITSLQAPGKSVGAASITIGSPTSWPTDTPVFLSIRVVNPSLVTTANPSGTSPGTLTVWKGILSGTTISNLTLQSGTDQIYTAGSNTQVYIGVSAAQMNSLIDGILTFANPDGSLKSTAVKTALGVSSTTGGGWDILNAGTAPTVASGYNKGNKEYTLTFNGVDLTSTLSAGMRLKFDRGTTAPTQSMSFTAASSQYATKASPTGITFTSAFTCEAWIYVTSYQTGAQGASIIGRTDTTTGGFMLRLNTSGQLSVYYAGSSTFSEWFSYQSVPLNRWVHVAASVSSVSGKTLSGMYINGVAVPTTTPGSLNSTTLVQTSNLSVGAGSAGVAGSFFNGYISEARVWSVAQTATQIQDNMAISLTGSETNLVALFQGNGNFTDKTTNANTLTATGGAIATQAANPYNTTEYAIVTKVAYATSTTTVTVFTGTDYNIPLGTLINPFSSFQKSPFGFNASRGKWVLDTYIRSNISYGSGTSGVWSNVGININVPTGEWDLSYEMSINAASGGIGNLTAFTTLSTTNNSSTDDRFNYTPNNVNASMTSTDFGASRRNPVSLTTATPYYLNLKPVATGVTTQVSGSGDAPGTIRAECSYI